MVAEVWQLQTLGAGGTVTSIQRASNGVVSTRPGYMVEGRRKRYFVWPRLSWGYKLHNRQCACCATAEFLFLFFFVQYWGLPLGAGE